MKFIHKYTTENDFNFDYSGQVRKETTSFTCSGLSGDFVWEREGSIEMAPEMIFQFWSNGSLELVTQIRNVSVDDVAFDISSMSPEHPQPDTYTITEVNETEFDPVYVEPWVSLTYNNSITVNGCDFKYYGMKKWIDSNDVANSPSYFWGPSDGSLIYGPDLFVRTDTATPPTGTSEVDSYYYRYESDAEAMFSDFSPEDQDEDPISISSVNEGKFTAYNRTKNYIEILEDYSIQSEPDFEEEISDSETLKYYSGFVKEVGPRFNNSSMSHYKVTVNIGIEVTGEKLGGPLYYGVSQTGNPPEVVFYDKGDIPQEDLYTYPQLVKRNGIWYVRTYSALS